MESPEIREAWGSFTTGVAFISTHGSRGPNVMSAEWTFNVSYEPFLISVHLDPEGATGGAIDETKEFGVNVVAEEQVAAMGFAGHFTRKETDKLSCQLFETYSGKAIKAPMIRGCLLNAECRLVDRVVMGDHVAFIGEVVEFVVDSSKKPVILHRGSRFLGEKIHRKEDVVVAATVRGGQVAVEGEVAGPDRGGKEVRVTVSDLHDVMVTEASTVTDARGYFELALLAPGSGEFVVSARVGSATGKARLKS